jgi:hypothetical protein
MDGLEREPRRPADVFRDRAARDVRNVDLATLEARHARDVVGNRAEHEPLHARLLPPVVLVRFQHHLDAGRRRYEPVRPSADRRLLEPVVADLLEILARHDPGGAVAGVA